MSALCAGLLCTALLMSGCACLFACISAVAHRMRRAQALHLALFLACFLTLAVLLARLPDCGQLSPRPWLVASALWMAASAAALLLQLRWVRHHVSQVSIKTSCDHLPCALCFALENGQPCLRNLKMDALSHQITGEALHNANAFWHALEKQPVVTLTSGQTWRFERTAMDIDGQRVYQLIGTDVTERARLNRALAEDNRRLDDMNHRLRAYSRNVQALAREKELLSAKVCIHDELGHTLLRTRQFLSDGRGSVEDIRASWRRNIRLLLGEGGDDAPAGSFRQLLSAAQAIGVAIDRRGEFPVEGTEAAYLTEAAIHESLTNLVRHAGGSRLEVTGALEADGWHICCRNDGAPPAGPIAEGGGLSSLRARVEAAGGAMRVEHAPRYALKLLLPDGNGGRLP